MIRRSFVFLFLTALLAAGCAPNNGDLTVNDPTKAEIEAFIDSHWQEYGYAAKPTKYIALSFDDGPCPPANYGGTVAMLAALETVKVKATFFVIGSQVRSYKTVAQAIYAAGHEIGNHSDGWTAVGGSTATTTINTSLNAASTAIREIIGEDPVLFRPPELNNGTNLDNVCKDLGMAIINGSVHSDWPASSAEAVKNSVLANPQDGGIIILHDNNTSQGGTMAALPDIVAGLRANGFWIMTVGELAIVKGKTLVAGTRYDTIK